MEGTTMTVLTAEQVDLLEDFCSDQGIEDLYKDYSGRCMYGKQCIGFVSDQNPFDLGIALAQFLRNEDNELLDAFENAGAKMDSMGLSTIVYFPSISIGG
jgi:hypothetical protein